MSMTATVLVCVLFPMLCTQVGWAQTVYKVTTISEDPFTIIKEQPDGRRAYNGYIISLLDELRKILGVDFNISQVPDNRYGSLRKDGTWDGMIGQLLRGEADIAAAPLTMTAARARVVDFTQPFMMSQPQILLKKPQKVSSQILGLTLLLNPFSAEVWITLAFAFVAVSVSLYVISRWSPFEWRQTSQETDAKETFSLSNSWLYTASTLLWQGYATSPKSISGRILSVFWWSFTLFILAAYIASLTGGFIINRPTQPYEMNRIRTFEDLAESGIQYGAIDGGSTSQMFRHSKDSLKQIMWLKMSTRPSSMVKSFSEGVERVATSDSPQYAFIGESQQLKFIAGNRCDMYVAGQILINRGLGFACRINLDILPRLNLALLELQERGRLMAIEDYWFKGTCDEQKEPETKVPRHFPKAELSLADSSSAFILLAIGIVISLLACALEIFLSRRGIWVPSGQDKKRSEDRDIKI